MGLIMNATKEAVQFKVFGNYFTLKPSQIKMFTDNMSHFIATERRELGLVSLPAEFEEPEFALTEDGKRIIAERAAEGVRNRIKKLKEIIYNNQVALRQDLEKANIKAAPEVFASEGEIKAMEELARYADDMAEVETKRVEHVQKLKEKIAKVR